MGKQVYKISNANYLSYIKYFKCYKKTYYKKKYFNKYKLEKSNIIVVITINTKKIKLCRYLASKARKTNKSNKFNFSKKLD